MFLRLGRSPELFRQVFDVERFADSAISIDGENPLH